MAETRKKIGPYEVIRPIARGGMGEVLLAFDPHAERTIALKQIREDLRESPVFKNRFLREAKLTAQLTHPGIISIFTIHEEPDLIYYTMPYVEGKTLKEILRSEENVSIPSLLPIFKSICQTVAYAHSKGIIHRDLKPENFLVGNFGEVIILDWGLAQIHGEISKEVDEEIVVKEENPDLTHPGKLVGTIAYMAPERAKGLHASVSTDIYALGVILYQILTLRFPFTRHSLKEFRKNAVLEKLINPEEKAPYRDVPFRLSAIAKKCLAFRAEDRYQTMEELLFDLLNHMEGRAEWFEMARLDIHKKSDWEFQENLLVSKNMAVTRNIESAEWISLMISSGSFPGNMRLETKVKMGKTGGGIGFLLSIPGVMIRENPLDGYCLWLATEEEGLSQLYRNSVVVMQMPDLFLKREKWHGVAIEKVGHNIHFTIDGVLNHRYISHLPLAGTHVGLLSRDADFEIEDVVISIGSQNLQVSCLSIPDAFLASKDYKRALTEYRRIGYSFPGHAEGREALFRAGITLMNQAKNTKTEKRAKTLYSQAIEEFSKLHNTPGAPLEYLGKALVYQHLNEKEEEIKCLELALRRYHKHPLSTLIKEQIVYRMHECAQYDRKSAYQLILIVLRHLPLIAEAPDLKRLLNHLSRHWEPLPFFEIPLENKAFDTHLAIELSFWLAQPLTLLEIFEDLLKKESLDPTLLGNLLFALFEMGSKEIAKKVIQQFKETAAFFDKENQDVLSLLDPLLIGEEISLEKGFEAFFSLQRKDMGVRELRTLLFLIDRALLQKKYALIDESALKIASYPLSKADRILLDGYLIWKALEGGQLKEAEALFETYSLELLNQESTLLYTLYGCYLYLTEGEELAQIHFAGVIDTPFPRSWALLGHELTNLILHAPAWFSQSFLWERRQLYRQLTLYAHITGNASQEETFRSLEKEQYIN